MFFQSFSSKWCTRTGFNFLKTCFTGCCYLEKEKDIWHQLMLPEKQAFLYKIIDVTWLFHVITVFFCCAISGSDLAMCTCKGTINQNTILSHQPIWFSLWSLNCTVLNKSIIVTFYLTCWGSDPFSIFHKSQSIETVQNLRENCKCNFWGTPFMFLAVFEHILSSASHLKRATFLTFLCFRSDLP